MFNNKEPELIDPFLLPSQRSTSTTTTPRSSSAAREKSTCWRTSMRSEWPKPSNWAPCWRRAAPATCASAWSTHSTCCCSGAVNLTRLRRQRDKSATVTIAAVDPWAFFFSFLFSSTRRKKQPRDGTQDEWINIPGVLHLGDSAEVQAWGESMDGLWMRDWDVCSAVKSRI